MDENSNSIGSIIRKNETDFISGTTQISKYVSFQLHDTVEKIEAYLNSKHISGEYDSQGRKKPFFNVVVAAANIWFRATDIDRSQIKIIATKTVDWLDAFIATIHLREWMRKESFGQFLNEWGRVLSRYGSAVIKFVENKDGLHIHVVPWNRLIIDSVNFAPNPKIEVLELTQGELYMRIDSHGYDREQVKALCEAISVRQTLDKQRKDNKSGYIKLYEISGNLSLEHLTHKEKDENIYVQQVHVISFVGMREGRKTEYQDFTLFAGKEKKDPYMITHLIKEDSRTLSIGAVEHLFETQWMENHSKKAVKDTLDVSSKIIFQTADANFVGRNVTTDIENGDILIHGLNGAISKVDMSKPELVSWQNFAAEWKAIGNEITGISEAMLGIAPKSGTPWRQTESLLQESYSLFELMTENKGLYIEEMMREWIIPYLKKQMDTSDEMMATLADYEIKTIDEIYMKKQAVKEYNKRTTDAILANAAELAKGNIPSPIQPFNMQAEQQSMQSAMAPLGNRRGFVPDELSDKTWKEQFKDLEWECEVDVTGESIDTKDALTTLNTALKLVVTPGFETNEKAKAIVGRILELAGAMDPIEYNALPATPAPVPSPIQNVQQPAAAVPTSTG